jgi:tetratricopeptide (TPR) repeat protein
MSSSSHVNGYGHSFDNKNPINNGGVLARDPRGAAAAPSQDNEKDGMIVNQKVAKPMIAINPLATSEWDEREIDVNVLGADGRTVEDRLDLLKAVGLKNFKEGKMRAAAKMFSDGIKIAPRSRNIHVFYANRSACLCALGDYYSAFNDAAKCIDIAPAYIKGHARKGAALHGMDRWIEAIAAYEYGLKFEATSAILLQGRDDAKRRLMLAGGEWKLVGSRSADGGKFFEFPKELCSAPG